MEILQREGIEFPNSFFLCVVYIQNHLPFLSAFLKGCLLFSCCIYLCHEIKKKKREKYCNLINYESSYHESHRNLSNKAKLNSNFAFLFFFFFFLFFFIIIIPTTTTKNVKYTTIKILSVSDLIFEILLIGLAEKLSAFIKVFTLAILYKKNKIAQLIN